MDIVNKLVEEKRLEDLYILARFMYRIGEPIVTDDIYDYIESEIKRVGVLESYTSRTYDDDPIPFELLKEFKLTDHVPPMLDESKYFKYLEEDKSLSIEAVTKYEEVFKFIMAKRTDMVLMLKCDGVNGKSLYLDRNLELTLSRGRSGSGFDYTKNSCKSVPTKLNTEERELKVFCEYFVYENCLEYMRNKYGKDKYKTPKSSAISMLRVTHDIEDYKYMGALAFGVEGLKAKTKIETLEFLKDNGFKTVPYLLLKWKDIPRSYDEFVIWLDKICSLFYKSTENLPSDGLVLEVNDLEYNDTVNNQYSNKNIAIKLSYWSFTKYRAIVEDIIIEQQRVVASCRVKIKPIRTKDGCEAKIVNVYNPRILINNDINIGSEIVFERNSGAINSLVYGTKLKE